MHQYVIPKLYRRLVDWVGSKGNLQDKKILLYEISKKRPFKCQKLYSILLDAIGRHSTLTRISSPVTLMEIMPMIPE